MMPNIILQLIPINKIRIITTLLYNQLAQSNNFNNSLQSGFVTIDQSRQLLLLRNDEEKLQELPLVGM